MPYIHNLKTLVCNIFDNCVHKTKFMFLKPKTYSVITALKNFRFWRFRVLDF